MARTTLYLLEEDAGKAVLSHALETGYGPVVAEMDGDFYSLSRAGG